ncbi:hypothetical protein SLEP1_g17780 [Rubroshorea leprosula]|uniref:Uncharacterized protein n=1 Tax=Rubroshorea leprosula TaxID=152421 RepID=A0AAV5J5X1_9ROSI|nr:hypothetical protein SLEP1_g17780 [Rubroshorea leprosula]
MFAEFNEFSVLGMLNSEIFLVKEQAEGIQFDISKRPSLEFQDECPHAATSVLIGIPQEQGEVEEERGGAVISTEPTILSPNFTEDAKEEEEHDAAVPEESGNIGKLSLGQLDDVTVGEEDDGFKTPTSPGHKITAVKQCPPAPRKPKSSIPSRKRRRQQVVLDVTEELESLFPKPDLHRKIRKVRREEN